MNLASYIKAGYSILYLVTAEEGRAELSILKCAQEMKRKIRVWSHTEGFFTPNEENPEAEQVEDPVEALIKLRDLPQKTIIIMRDLHMFLNTAKTVRQLRDIARDFKQQHKTLIIISAVKKIPPELERDITVLEFELPTKDEIADIFQRLYATNQKNIGAIDPDEQERIIQSALGLTTVEAESAFAKAIVDHSLSGKNEAISRLVMKEKAIAVKKSGILEYFETKQTIDDIGGLDILKEWLQLRSKAFSKAAKDFGLKSPKGVLLCGPPGAGKSLCAKAASNILGVPLLKFDIGKVFGSLVGDSERNCRTAIQTAESIGASILFLDEIDKGFAGMGGGGSHDSGTSARVFGTLLTWMQERTSPCFVIATINRIEGLPPELLRKGRFDEIFFVGLPAEKERDQILKIHLGKTGRDIKKFKDEDIRKCAKASEGFSGAELEECVNSGMYLAFNAGRDLMMDDILKAIKSTNPLSRSKGKELQEMAAWAEANAVNASKVEKEKPKKIEVNRQLEI